MSDEEIVRFTDITGASPAVALGLLEVAGGNFESAIQLFFDSPDLVGSLNTQTSTATPQQSTSHARSAPTDSRPSAGRQDEHGVIHIDSDDDGDTHVTIDDDDDDDFNIPDEDPDDTSVAQVAEIARTAQEEEDAAMAKRLQEELYSENATGDGVRSPIARTTETLVDPYGDGGFHSTFSDFQRQQQLLRPPRGSEQYTSRVTLWC
jgi:UBX domain-containing protein 7